jgi:hypothetical protein
MVMSRKIKAIEKKIYLPVSGSIEELNIAMEKVQKYIDKHEWMRYPHYIIHKEYIELVGTRYRSEHTDEIPIVVFDEVREYPRPSAGHRTPPQATDEMLEKWRNFKQTNNWDNKI